MIVKSPETEIDLLDIWAFIASNNPVKATEFLRAIERKLQMLAESPGMGQRREELAPSLRSFPIGNYVIFYRPLQDGIEVARILHGARDVLAIFRPRNEE